MSAAPIDVPMPDGALNRTKPAPAEAASFFVEMPVPAALAGSGADRLSRIWSFWTAIAAALPNRTFEPLLSNEILYRWPRPAGDLRAVATEPRITASCPRERRLEVRDFVRSCPVVRVDLSPAGETGLETSERSHGLKFSSTPAELSASGTRTPRRFSDSVASWATWRAYSFEHVSGQEEYMEREQDAAVALRNRSQRNLLSRVIPDEVIQIEEPTL